MKELRGRNAILTGASRGIGPYIGRALADAGVNLALAARSSGPLEQVAQELSSRGVRTIAIPTDVTDATARTALVERAETELGPIDILVNNAGLGRPERFERTSPEDILQTIETNLVAPLLLTRSVLPGMLARGRGHIVDISSIAGKKGGPYGVAYVATKSGLIEANNAFRCEFEGTGVSASVICPGFVSEVGMFVSWGETPPRLLGQVSPDEVAQAVVRALREDLLEVFVTPGPVWPLLVINAISSRLANKLGKRLGLFDLLRRVADKSEAA